MFSFAAQHIVKLSGDVLLAAFLHMSACRMRPAYGHFPSSDGVLVLRMCTHWGHSASYMQLHPRCKATAAVAIAALGECVGYFFCLGCTGPTGHGFVCSKSADLSYLSTALLPSASSQAVIFIWPKSSEVGTYATRGGMHELGRDMCGDWGVTCVFLCGSLALVFGAG